MNLNERTILDLGCGPSPISDHFPHHPPFIVGLDKNKRYLTQAQKNTSLELVLADATSIPFRDGSFDFVLCNDVLEHVCDERRLMQELLRVLACNGSAYIQCANKYQIIEPHFLLPFLSWIPKRLANIYVKATSKGKSYDGYYPRTRRRVLELTSAHRTIDLTYERALRKITDLNIESNTLSRTVSIAKRVLPDRLIAALAQNFSVISVLVFKD